MRLRDGVMVLFDVLSPDCRLSFQGLFALMDPLLVKGCAFPLVYMPSNFLLDVAHYEFHLVSPAYFCISLNIRELPSGVKQLEPSKEGLNQPLAGPHATPLPRARAPRGSAWGPVV